MKKIILFCFFNLSVFAMVSQNTYDSIIKPRLSFTSNKVESTNLSKFIIDKDTFYANYKKSPDLDYLNSSNYSYRRMLKYYQRIVFCYTTDSPPIIYELKQWSTDIVVYLDKKISKEVKRDFQSFYTSEHLKSINNLNITFTKNIEKANYLIQTTTHEINGYDDNKEFTSEEERINNLFTGANYRLITDGNNKFYGGTLTINLKNASRNNNELLKKLKQIFYKSLGNFVADNYKDNNSLLHKKYDNSNTISEFDINILKIHYETIYDQKINSEIFNKLLKISKNN